MFKARLNEEELSVHPFRGHTRKCIEQYLGMLFKKCLDVLITY